MLVGKPEGKGTLGIHRRVGREGSGCEVVGLINLTQDRVQCRAVLNTVMKFGAFLNHRFSRRTWNQ